MKVNELVLVFKQYYNHSNVRIFFESGPQNNFEEITGLIESNDNYLSQSIGIYIIASKTETNLIRLVSLNFEELGIIEISLDELDDEIRHDWTNYLKKTISYLKQAGYCFNSGLDLLVYGNIPNEVGLSSTRTIEALTKAMLQTVY